MNAEYFMYTLAVHRSQMKLMYAWNSNYSEWNLLKAPGSHDQQRSDQNEWVK